MKKVNTLEGSKTKFISIIYGTNNKQSALAQDLVMTLLEQKDLTVAANSTFIDMSAESSLDLVKSLTGKGLKDIAAPLGNPVPDHGSAFSFILLAV